MENKDLQKLLQKQQYSFKPYFADRLIEKIESTKEKIEFNFEKMLDFLFPKITTFSFGIVALFLVSSIVYHGSFDIDTIIGLNNYEQNIGYQGITDLY